MKIYTKTGDEGSTSLFGGKRVPKYADRIEAYGTIDELNSFIGELRDSLHLEDIKVFLKKLQNDCFDIGSVLATDPTSEFNLQGVTEQDVLSIENEIDKMQSVLPELKTFILPSGHLLVSKSHICRTVCRRAERRVVALNESEAVDRVILLYLNRLSDYFFVLGRFIGHSLNVAEVHWQKRS